MPPVQYIATVLPALNVGWKVPEMRHARVHRAAKTPQLELEAVAVVDDHGVGVVQQLAPALRADVGVGPL
jgi:hypothetical protein